MSPIYIRQATKNDLEQIMPIIDEAKKFLKEEGNPQWQSGYPDVETITTDIDDGVAWVLIVDQKIAGYTAITDGPDPNYKKIDGKWENDLDPYVAIHRVAISDEYRGMHIYDDSVNILTNFSVFPAQIEKLTDFAAVSPAQPKNTIVPNVDLNMYSRGLGTRHLLGGMDSSSRFVKVAFTLAHAPKSDDETESVTNFFNILHSVEQAKRLDEIEPSKFEYTMYSDCMNLDKGILYFTTYDNNQIDAVDMNS